MPKTEKTPESVLKALMEEYQLTPFALSKAINLSNSAILQISKGKGKITVPTALRFAKFFGQSPTFWLDLQREADLAEAAKDKDLQAIVKGIDKVKKPAAKVKSKSAPKPLRKATLSDKRKKAAKAPGSRAAKRTAKK